MSISSGTSRMANLHLQGVETADPREAFGPSFATRLAAWQDRPDPSRPGAELLRDEAVAYFVINREGSVSEYWPDQECNDLSESIFREFSEDDRVWERTDDTPVCVHLTCHVLNEEEEMTQVLCPFRDDPDGKITGFVVVCKR